MKLSERLHRPVSLESPGLRDLDDLSLAAGRVLERWPDGVPDPPEKDRDRLVQQMAERIAADQWQGLRLSVVLATARALFDPERRARPELDALRSFYLDEIAATSRQAFLDGMMAVHLDSYAPDAPHTRALAAALAAHRGDLGPRWQTLLAELPACLDPVDAPAAVAERMRTMADPWSGLKAIGLRTPHAPGLMDHAHLAFVAGLAPKLRARASIDRLLGWLKPEGQPLARQSGASEALEALLAPWHTDNPDPDLTSHLVQSLVGLYGDPRVTRSGVWMGVSEAGQAPLLRWLTGETMRFFLDVMAEAEDRRQWEARREFWLGLYDMGQIEAAWIAFSREGARHAEQISRTRGARGTLSFGIQTAGGSRRGASLLILKMGHRIVVEGSHDVKIHIFDSSNPKAPRLYQETYDSDAIRNLPGSLSHAHQSGWQYWVQVSL